MTELDFQQVVDKSFQIPVLVDFWAPWCAPCKYLNTVLEKLNSGASGKWLLYKINVEEETELAERLRIRTIPSLKLFHKGKQVSALNGALSEYELTGWLEKNLPDEVQEEWGKLIQEISPEELFFPNYRIQEFVSHYRNYEPAILYLALSRVATEPRFTATVLARLHPRAEFIDLRDDIQAMHDFFTLQETDRKVSHILASSAESIRKRQFREGLELLIQAVMLDKHYADDMPRRAGVAFFRILGTEHPLTRNYRRRFDMALY